MVDAISAESASRIGCTLSDVMEELRALVDASQQFASLQSDTLPVLTEAICKRAHVMLDRCAIALVQAPCGNFVDDENLESEAADD